MKKIKTMLEDYKLKLKIVEEKIENEENDIMVAMLSTKASCYKIFIKDLEKIINEPFKSGDIVVWSGNTPCICKLQSEMSADNHSFPGCYYVNESHNSLHYSYLRFATNKEIERLGDQIMILI